MGNPLRESPIAMHITQRLKSLPLLAMLCLTSLAHAQPTAAAPLALQATNLAGERFAAPERLRGKVSIVFFWSTTCAVCRDSLPELRATPELADMVVLQRGSRLSITPVSAAHRTFITRRLMGV